MATQELVFTPLLHEDQIGSSALDLRLGNIFKLVRSRGVPHIEPRNYRPRTPSDSLEYFKAQQQKLERYDVPFNKSFYLHPGTLALVPTLEWCKLPQDVQGLVTARSSWAREGLSIATATFINPGFAGIITLELANLGAIPMKLYPGLRVAQIALYGVGESGQQRDESPSFGSPTPTKSQFDASFEPNAGNLWNPDVDPFIPET